MEVRTPHLSIPAFILVPMHHTLTVTVACHDVWRITHTSPPGTWITYPHFDITCLSHMCSHLLHTSTAVGSCRDGQVGPAAGGAG